MTRLHVFSLAACLCSTAAFAQTQAPPIPKPFPSAGQPAATAPIAQTPPDDALGLPVYPAAQFLEILDAGKGQQYYLYGTDAPYEDIVTYYKATLKNGGRTIFQGPLMHQFELGRFDDDTMAYPPSVVVKDYTWNGADGYLHVSGISSIRYKTVIQIVPPPGR